MKIAAVVVTCDRLELLQRALASINVQSRKPDIVFVISNSTGESFNAEQQLCNAFDFIFLKNYRTTNYAGALNTAVEEIIKRNGIEDEMYFASLDDDDEWLPDYLKRIEANNDKNFDLLAANYLRSSPKENLLLELPNELSAKDFLQGNPGIGGSNTFVRLTILLRAGCFDEALPATVDRDILVRIFQQQPTYKVIPEHLVTAHTDTNRRRVTTDSQKKKQSLQIFFYKYQHLMTDAGKELFFARAINLFSISKEDIENFQSNSSITVKQEIQFKVKGNYQFVIGFIVGNETIAERIAKQITGRNIPVDLILIIDDIPKGKSLAVCEEILRSKNVLYKIIKHDEWKINLESGHYGSYFKQFSEINSIPLGRTILHHHLFTETTEMKNPVYWIIDDDVSFDSTISESGKREAVDLFKIINESIGVADAMIGSISNDPPVPTLCCIRGQLIDFLYSHYAKNTFASDCLNISSKPDYYYDLSDVHCDHLEMPIYHTASGEKGLHQIFSGKALSRPALQRPLKAVAKTITKRGANTLVLNRELLQYYPVINLEVNHKFARRGDLLWALLNQVVSNRNILEHTFSLDHNRSSSEFDLRKELEKAAYDIIGYAFNKGIVEVINEIKEETNPNRPKDIFDELNQDKYHQKFLNIYNHFLQKRKSRFLMNFYRIVGLITILYENYELARKLHKEVSDHDALNGFQYILDEGQNEETLRNFFKDLTNVIWSYSKSITTISEDDAEHRQKIENYFGLKRKLRKLGRGAEGIVFTDENFVYKSYFNILDHEWGFLKEKSRCFSNDLLLEIIECFETGENRFVRYPYYLNQPLQKGGTKEIVSFLKFCKANGFVFTNIKPSNFIMTVAGQLKLIDYGKSFEPFTDEKFLNTIKRAYLFLKFPKMEDEEFQKLTSLINIGEEPKEIQGWESLRDAVLPRNKEEILDGEIISIIKSQSSKRILDYGSGKCKTARRIKKEIGADIYVYDVNEEVLEKRCNGFPRYNPTTTALEKYFDCVLLNLVLCEVENSVVDKILSNVSKSLLPHGKVIISVCNPDYAHIHKTEFQNRSTIPKNNSVEEIIEKTSVDTGKKRLEYHRPTTKYIDMFSKFGFTVISNTDTKGVNIETLEIASDFKIFVLKNNE